MKIDDQFSDHPKIVEAGPEAAWLHVCALCYSARFLTDGVITDAQLVRLSALSSPVDAAAALVETGLWERVDGGYQIHDYLDFNPSRSDVITRRQKAADRVASWRDKHRNKAPKRNAVTNAVSTQEVRMPPYPYPSSKEEEAVPPPQPLSLDQKSVLKVLRSVIPSDCPDPDRQEGRIVEYARSFADVLDVLAVADDLRAYQDDLISGVQKRKGGPYRDIASAYRDKLARDKRTGHNLRSSIIPNGNGPPREEIPWVDNDDPRVQAELEEWRQRDEEMRARANERQRTHRSR